MTSIFFLVSAKHAATGRTFEDVTFELHLDGAFFFAEVEQFGIGPLEDSYDAAIGALIARGGYAPTKIRESKVVDLEKRIAAIKASEEFHRGKPGIDSLLERMSDALAARRQKEAGGMSTESDAAFLVEMAAHLRRTSPASLSYENNAKRLERIARELAMLTRDPRLAS